MMRRLMPIIFAVALGLVGVVATQQYLRQQRASFEQERAKLLADYEAPTKVIVAKKDISEGTTLTIEMLGAADVPEKFIQPYAALHATDVVDQVTLVPLAEGEQVMRNKVRPPGQAVSGDSLSKQTPPGKRAVTLGLDSLTGVGGFIRPGDAVDVLWSFQAPQAGESDGHGDLVTAILLQDVPVLAVGGQLAGGTSRARDSRSRDDDTAGQSQGYTVTVGLNPQEAEVLLYARERGKIEVALRPHAPQEAQVAVRPADIGLIMETVMGQAPSSPESGPTQRSVEVFKGLERQIVTLQE